MSATARADQLALPRRPRRDGRQDERGDQRLAERSAAGASARCNYRLRDWRRLAPALLGLPDPDDPLRGLRRRAGAGGGPAGAQLPDDVTFDRPGNPLDRHPTWKTRRLPAAAASRRGARPTPWTPSSTRPGISRASPTREREPRRPTRSGRRSLAAGRPVYRRRRARDPASALLRASSRRAMKQTGHRRSRTSRSPACSPRAWSCHETYRDAARRVAAAGRGVKIERRRRPRARIARPASRSRSADREDVEVEEERRRPRRRSS